MTDRFFLKEIKNTLLSTLAKRAGMFLLLNKAKPNRILLKENGTLLQHLFGLDFIPEPFFSS